MKIQLRGCLHTFRLSRCSIKILLVGAPLMTGQQQKISWRLVNFAAYININIHICKYDRLEGASFLPDDSISVRMHFVLSHFHRMRLLITTHRSIYQTKAPRSIP